MENDAFAGALNPGRPVYKYTTREGGCSKISEEFDNFHLPFEGEVEWEEPHELIKEGINLIESIKGSKYKLDSEQLVDPKTVVSFPAVEANTSHLPGTEEDAIKVDVRHWTNAVDEIIRASEPQLPKMVSWWMSEVSGSVAKVYKADTATATQIAIDSILKAVRIAMATQSRPSSAASYRKRSPIRKTTSRGSPSAAGGGRNRRGGGGQSRGTRDRERSASPQPTAPFMAPPASAIAAPGASPASSFAPPVAAPAAAPDASPAAPPAAPPVAAPDASPASSFAALEQPSGSDATAAPYLAEMVHLAEQSSVTGDPFERISADRLVDHVRSVGIVNAMRKLCDPKVDPLVMPYLLARVDCLHGRAPEGCTDTTLKLGIPNGISRPTNAEEYKRPGYVSKFIDNLRKWAKREPMEPPKRGCGQSSKFPSAGDDPNIPGIRKNIRQATPLNTGNLHLLKQGFGYILQHRIRCVELTDSMGSVFLEALGLKIDEFTTSPELFRQALKSGPIGAGKLRVTAIEQHQREHIIAARVAFRDRARRGVPDDIVSEGPQPRPADDYRKHEFTDDEIPQMEELMYGVWLSLKRKKRSVSRGE
ncbi:hypothetical protein GQ607_017360 [Colletotrichum asianum]|uniref:Uncharacterized protein n=1 Tax=Colletotrichum asianum TaxID=702518 RepID=A0A8H3VZ76_9PEZI|nr:hypothetical protein GQ607_017360 [Colletotrichum asianum]